MKVYDPDQIVMAFGSILLKDFADGEFVTIEEESDSFSDVAGSDGAVVRSKTNDRRATVTFKLLQTSESNALLSAVHNADLLAPNGAGVVALEIKDLQGTSLYHAPEAWIAKPPDVSFGREASSREWKIRCARLVRVDGGN